MKKYLIYILGFFLSFVLVFLVVYGLTTAFRSKVSSPEETPGDQSEEQSQEEEYLGTIDSLEIASEAAYDSIYEKAIEARYKDMVGDYSPEEIGALFSYILGKEGGRTATPDSAAIRAWVAMEGGNYVASLDSLRAEIKVFMKAFEKQASQSQPSRKQNKHKRLAKIYNSMEPANAAEILSTLSDESVVAILILMKERQVAEVLAAMSPERAAKLSKMMAQGD